MTVILAGQVTNRTSIPGREKKIIFSRNVQIGSVGPSSFLSDGCHGVFRRMQQACQDDHAPTFSAEFNMAEAIFAVSYMDSWCQEDNSMLLHFVRPEGILGADIRKGAI